MKKLLALIVLILMTVYGYSQEPILELSGKTWTFCVVDSLIEPYECVEQVSAFKFKKSGQYVEKMEEGFILYGKTITKRTGTWRLNGTTLELDPDDLKMMVFHPRSIELVVIDENTFYSVQPDVRTVYWLYRRTK